MSSVSHKLTYPLATFSYESAFQMWLNPIIFWRSMKAYFNANNCPDVSFQSNVIVVVPTTRQNPNNLQHVSMAASFEITLVITLKDNSYVPEQLLWIFQDGYFVFTRWCLNRPENLMVHEVRGNQLKPANKHGSQRHRPGNTTSSSPAPFFFFVSQ